MNVTVSGSVDLGSGAVIRANGNAGVSGQTEYSSSYSTPVSGGGGGSGGSVLIVAAQVQGNGTIEANGGAGGVGGRNTHRGYVGQHGGGGGGGRVSLHLSLPLPALVSMSAAGGDRGGSGAAYGPAGTAYTDVAGERTLMLVNPQTMSRTSMGTAMVPASGNAQLNIETLVVTRTNVAIQCPVHASVHIIVGQSSVVAAEPLQVRAAA